MENQSSCLCRIKLSIKLKIIDEFDINNKKKYKIRLFYVDKHDVNEGKQHNLP